MSRRRTAAAVLAATALTALAACSDNGGGAASTTVGTTTAPVTTSAAGPGTTAAAPGTTAPGAATTPATGSPTTGAATTAAPAGDLAAAQVKLTQIASLKEPVFLAQRPGDGDSIYIAERGGRIRVLRDGAVADQPVLDFSDRTVAGGERGFLGFAFSPDGTHLYVDYTDTNGDSNVDEYAVSATGAIEAGSRRQVLFQAQPYPNHNGGDVMFGPDGYLYIGFGDGGSAGDPKRNGLNLGTWLGKILRIDPAASGDQPYTVPADNPFVGTSGAKPEIWSYGLRNPWRFSWDAANGDLWIGDVGQDTLEEVDWSTVAEGAGKGVNFGWSAFEGTNRYNDDQPTAGAVPPLFDYSHADGGVSVTGGFVYRGDAIPALRGAYLYADYGEKGVRAVSVGADGKASPAKQLTTDPRAIVSFGQGPGHELYVLSLDGGVYRIDPA